MEIKKKFRMGNKKIGEIIIRYPGATRSQWNKLRFFMETLFKEITRLELKNKFK